MGGKIVGIMLSKCANPVCSATFRYLHDGKLFLIQGAPKHSLRYFWLCDSCSRTMTLVTEKKGDGIEVIEKQAPGEFYTPTVTRVEHRSP